MGSGASSRKQASQGHGAESYDTLATETQTASRPYSQSGQAEGSLAHLGKLRASLLREVALELDKAAALACIERRDLEKVVLDRLGVEAANIRAYDQRLDVREAKGLLAILERLVQEATSLAAHAEDGKQYIEEHLEHELHATSPSSDICEQLIAAAAEANDHVMAVQTVVGDAQGQVDSLRTQLVQCFHHADGTELPDFKDLANRVAKLLAMLAPATLGVNTSLAVVFARSEDLSVPPPALADGNVELEEESLAEDAGCQAKREQLLQEEAACWQQRRSFSDLAAVSESERKSLIEAHVARMARTMDALADEREAQRLRLQRQRSQLRGSGSQRYEPQARGKSVR